MIFRVVCLGFLLLLPTLAATQTRYPAPVDFIDVLNRIPQPFRFNHEDSLSIKPGQLHFSVAPGAGYSLTSGLGVIVAANAAFHTSATGKLSNIFGDVVVTEREQLIVHFQGNVWSAGNKLNFITDWRYLKYPQQTFGIGSETDGDHTSDQDYSYLRLYNSVLRMVQPNLYVGGGYHLDHHWNVEQTNVDPVIQAQTDAYGFPEHTTSSGVSAQILFDNRLNAINPEGGSYASLTYRTNQTWLGSNTQWDMLRIDLRTYRHFPAQSRNILALWSYSWLTVSGSPPYLDLPSTGWDSYNNTGRGYIQGRFRGKNMVYAEAEYRFGILRNGLLGGVVFANAQSFSGGYSGTLGSVNPAIGAGLRLKINKHSGTNLAIDYGIGRGGSQGIFINLGEVF